VRQEYYYFISCYTWNFFCSLLTPTRTDQSGTRLKGLQENPIVPMDPHMIIIQFHIQGRTITRDFKRTVREMIQIAPIRTFYCNRFEWSENIFKAIDWDIFQPVYKKHISSTGIQWLHKYCIQKLPTAERIHKRDHFHDKRCTSCWHSVEDDDHLFRCTKRRSQRKGIVKQINILQNSVDPVLCNILKEGLLLYFNGECMTNTMLRIRGQEGMEKCSLLIDQQLVIGWVQGNKQKRHERRKKYKDKNKGTKQNKMVAFHSFFKSIIPIMK
jgi:hypothetical protein